MCSPRPKTSALHNWRTACSLLALCGTRLSKKLSKASNLFQSLIARNNDHLRGVTHGLKALVTLLRCFRPPQLQPCGCCNIIVVYNLLPVHYQQLQKASRAAERPHASSSGTRKKHHQPWLGRGLCDRFLLRVVLTFNW